MSISGFSTTIASILVGRIKVEDRTAFIFEKIEEKVRLEKLDNNIKM